MKKNCWITLCLFAIGFIFTLHTDLDAKGHEKFKVAMLLPGSISDAGWNALAYEGLKAIEKELGAEISHAETRNPDRPRRTIPFLCTRRVSHGVWTRI